MPDDDTKAFRKAMTDVRPLPARKLPPAPPKPRAVARFSRGERVGTLREGPRDSAQLGSLADDDRVAFRRAGVRDDVLRKLRRGQFAVEAEIDLHGLDRHATHKALRDFIGTAIGRRLRCVRVIHGKGLRSGPGGPVLRHVVNDWLSRIENVLAFASARPVDGGTGAVYVLLSLPAAPRRPHRE